MMKARADAIYLRGVQGVVRLGQGQVQHRPTSQVHSDIKPSRSFAKDPGACSFLHGLFVMQTGLHF